MRSNTAEIAALCVQGVLFAIMGWGLWFGSLLFLGMLLTFSLVTVAAYVLCAGAFLGWLWVYRRQALLKQLRALRFRRWRGGYPLRTLGVVVGGLAVGASVRALPLVALGFAHGAEWRFPQLLVMQGNISAVAGEAVSLCYLIVLVPFIEEAVFRGWLQLRLEALSRPMTAVTIAAVLFTALHMQQWPDPAILGATFVVGMSCGWVSHRLDSVWSAVLVHSASNAAGLTAGALLASSAGVWIGQRRGAVVTLVGLTLCAGLALLVGTARGSPSATSPSARRDRAGTGALGPD